MINGNRIKFGYGDIAVIAGFFGNIILQQFKPPQEIGSNVDHKAVEWIGESISVGFSYDDLVKLRAQLGQVEERKYFEFEFEGYVFDFANYNVKSVQACISVTNVAIGNVIKLMAC